MDIEDNIFGRPSGLSGFLEMPMERNGGEMDGEVFLSLSIVDRNVGGGVACRYAWGIIIVSDPCFSRWDLEAFPQNKLAKYPYARRSR